MSRSTHLGEVVVEVGNALPKASQKHLTARNIYDVLFPHPQEELYSGLHEKKAYHTNFNSYVASTTREVLFL